jgi:hypothetical protein
VSVRTFPKRNSSELNHEQGALNINFANTGSVKSTSVRHPLCRCQISSGKLARPKHIDKLIAVVLLVMIMEVSVTVYTHNHKLIFDLVEASEASLGMEKHICKELTLRYDYAKIRKALGYPEMIQFTLIVAENIGAGVASGLITAWLLKKLDKAEAQVSSLRIDRTMVELKEDKIRKIVHEKIRKKN